MKLREFSDDLVGRRSQKEDWMQKLFCSEFGFGYSRTEGFAYTRLCMSFSFERMDIFRSGIPS